jgi:hypothetical protein
MLPCLAALDAVVVPIVLRDLFLLVLRLAHSPPPFCGHLVVLEHRLLRKRCLRRYKVGALQLESKARANQ